MKNLTKAELISKINGLKQKTNPTLFSKLMNVLLILKSFLIKLTLISLIFKIFKRFKIIRRIWIIVNTIVMSIFGISMLDIYGLSIISAFITEITEVTGNIVSYLSNTKFYTIISGFLGFKVESPKTRMSTVDQSSTGDKESNKIIERFTKIIHNEPEITKEDDPFYKNKYFILGTFLLISGLTYYYFGDEIKTYSLSLWELFRRRGEGGPDNPPRRPRLDQDNGTNGNNMNPISNFLGLNRNNGLFSHFVGDDDPTEAIEVVNEAATTERLEKAVKFVDQSKPVPSSSFTSPSMDNLNETVAETWSYSRPTSPESAASSTGTIKPSSLPKIKIGTSNSSLPNLPPFDQALNIPNTPEEYIDELLTPNEIHFKPFADVEEINGNLQYVYNEDNWKSFANKGIQDRMDWIEGVITTGNISDLDEKNLQRLHSKASDIVYSYNCYASAFEAKRGDFDNETSKPLKLFAYLMRDWLNKHLRIIWPDENINIPVGDKTDSPIEVTKNIFDIEAHVHSDSDSDSD